MGNGLRIMDYDVRIWIMDYGSGIKDNGLVFL